MRDPILSLILLALTGGSALFGTQLPAAQDGQSTGEGIVERLSKIPMDAARHKEVEQAIELKQYKRAEQILVEEAGHDPQSARSAQLLVVAGGIFFLDGEFLNSAIAWKKSEAIAPLDDASRFTLAMAYIELRHPNWARQELDRLSAKQPKNPLYLYWLARLDYDAQNYTGAIDRLKTVIQIDPRMMRAYESLGLCYEYLGDSAKAIENYDVAVDLNRRAPVRSPWPNLNLAVSLIAVNRLPDAEESLREAISYDPRLPQAQYQLGRVLEMRGDDIGAVAALKQAASLDSNYAAPHYLLGRIYERLGESGLARSEVARFQQLKNPAGNQTTPSPQK